MQTFEFFAPHRCIREPFPAPRDEACVRHSLPHLAQLADRLELARATVVACIAALRLQNCELDEDIANVLQRHVADALGAQIERIQMQLAAPDELDA